MDYNDEISMYCEGCGEPIYIEDHYYVINGTVYCESCINDCRRLATETAKEFAILESEMV